MRSSASRASTKPPDLLELMERATSEDQLLAEVATTLKDALAADSCELLLATSAGGLIVRGSTAFPELIGHLRLGKGVGLAGHVLALGKPLIVPSKLTAHGRYANIPGVSELEYQSAYIIPIPGETSPQGIVFLRRLEPWKPTRHERKLAEALVEQFSHCWRIYRRAYEAGSQANRLGALTEVTRTITSSPYLEEILQLLVNLTARRFNYRVVTVRLLDEKRQELILRATQATNKAYQRKRAIRLGESIAGRAILENRTIIVEDVKTEAEYIGHDLAEEQGLRSMICIPLTLQDKPVGVLTCYTGEVREFTEDEIAALETIAQQAAISIEHAKLQVRNTLMQEMHHRVKNNLQQVASLLRLQMRDSNYRTVEEAIGDSLGRILAIAAVHELLSREDLDHVGIKSIAEMLVQHQQQSFLLPGKRVSFAVRGDDVHLNTTQATQVALILNEMLQNAVEHGFKSVDEGEVHITVEERNGQIGVWVSDKGDPLPPGFDVKQGRLGLQIIRSLAGSLGGELVMEDRLGWTVAEVKFARASGE